MCFDNKFLLVKYNKITFLSSKGIDTDTVVIIQLIGPYCQPGLQELIVSVAILAVHGILKTVPELSTYYEHLTPVGLI